MSNRDEIIRLLEEEIAEAKKEYDEKVGGALNALKALGADKRILTPNKSLDTKKPPKEVQEGSMVYKILTVLQSANKPLTSRQIMDAINLNFSKNPYDFAKFSGNFSQSYGKAGIKKYTRSNVPFFERVVYALPEWCDATGELKREYRDKLGELL